MHNFRKVICSVLAIIMVFSVCSVAFIVPYMNSEMLHYQDRVLRNSLKGTLDFLTIGASNGLCAFDTEVLDRELGCNSYNLGATLMTMDSRDFFLRKEIERNPIRTVVIDVSYETITRNESEEYAEGDSVSIVRADPGMDRINFITQCVNPRDYLNLYAQLVFPSIEYWLTLLKGADAHIDYTKKGFLSRSTSSVVLSPEEAQNAVEWKEDEATFQESNILKLKKQIQYCNENGIEVILAVVPRSDAELWSSRHQTSFYSEFESIVKSIAEETNCKFYDFNLLKNRYQIFNDDNSYFNIGHMSGDGAAVFTEEFCRILKMGMNEDLDHYFYSSYDEMLADSPYMEYLQ